MTQFSLETIQQEFKIHDSYQLEIKLDYELIENKNSHYQVHTYFFIPQSLGIAEEKFSTQKIAGNFQNYIRLKTPPFNFNEFFDHEHSPLNVITALMDSPDWRKDTETGKCILEQFKLFSAMIKTAIRDHLELVNLRLETAPSETNAAHHLKELINNYTKGANKISKLYRKLFRHFSAAYISPELFQAYQLTDESLSILFEEGAVDMYRMLDEHFKEEELEADLIQFRQELQTLAQTESEHRRSLGYLSILQPKGHNETFINRVSALKKYSSKVLHLEIAEQKEGRMLEQLGFALAAGLSMIFATVVAFYYQTNYGSFTLPVFAALVVGYMFKDRIKELMRDYIAGTLLNKFFDHRINIRKEGKRQKLGMIKKKVFFSSASRVPNQVMRKREESITDLLDDNIQGETVLCHARDISLRAAAFEQIFTSNLSVTGINDIIRMDVRFLLNRMDDPTQERFTLGTDGVQVVRGRKVYFVYVVSKYKSLAPHKETMYKLHRVVLNRKGIIRVENLG